MREVLLFQAAVLTLVLAAGLIGNEFAVSDAKWALIPVTIVVSSALGYFGITAITTRRHQEALAYLLGAPDANNVAPDPEETIPSRPVVRTEWLPRIAIRRPSLVSSLGMAFIMVAALLAGGFFDVATTSDPSENVVPQAIPRGYGRSTCDALLPCFNLWLQCSGSYACEDEGDWFGCRSGQCISLLAPES